VCGKKIGPDPRNFNQRVSLGRNDLLIRTFLNVVTSFAIDNTHSVALQQDFFDKVFPNILPMAYTLLMYYFLRVKKAHPVLLIGVTFVLSIVCSAFGIL
ncbi:PTS system mannose/fructose/sorbose family transporter subunit IID, partial [Escherichia coli]|uniref:PTS system mannose/fructose/sorbose family transporter subunit IID n=1 Tax=Escherichia coli TaxID=562 RepID=UPI0020CF87B7